MKPERLIYLGYHFKKADYAKLSVFRKYVSEQYGMSSAAQWKDVIYCSLRYNISLIDYYLFRFFELNHEEREKWAGTGFMYEYQKQMNPISERAVLEEKPAFFSVYSPFIRHKAITLKDIDNNPGMVSEFLNNGSEKLVLKYSKGQCGRGIEILPSSGFTPESLMARLKKTGNDMAEEFVIQHPRLMELSSSGLNTVRIITQLDENNRVVILGARIRITVNSSVDNLAAGNIAAPIDLETGMISGPGIYSDITKEVVTVHPVTGKTVEGVQIPFWKESVEMVKKAALHHTGNRSIGWDVAITEQGPELIEGNHDWCKLLWQLPVKQGLKSELEKYIE